MKVKTREVRNIIYTMVTQGKSPVMDRPSMEYTERRD